MKKYFSQTQVFTFPTIIILGTACNGPVKKDLPKETVSESNKISVNTWIVKANGKVVIDRTKWDVRYNSGKFYDNLADKTNSDSIEFYIKNVAKK